MANWSLLPSVLVSAVSDFFAWRESLLSFPLVCTRWSQVRCKFRHKTDTPHDDWLVDNLRTLGVIQRNRLNYLSIDLCALKRSKRRSNTVCERLLQNIPCLRRVSFPHRPEIKSVFTHGRHTWCEHNAHVIELQCWHGEWFRKPGALFVPISGARTKCCECFK